VATFRFSRRAEADVLGIAEYTLRTWGKHQTALYLNKLEACCKRLADTPALERPCDEIQPGLHRLEHGKHDLFYSQKRGGILVSRILHQSMLPERHPIEDLDDDR
jgi:toxin ParE1/3/4